MRTGKQLAACLTLCLALLTGSPAQAAPAEGTEVDLGAYDFAFVDADDTTGYYVDLNEQNFRSDTEVTACIEMVKADQKRLYLYTVYFNQKRQLYQVLKSVIADYDTKLIVGGSDTPLRPAHYENGTMMAIMADYIFHPY